MAYNTRLSTVMDVAPADDVASNVFLRPSLPLRLADTVTLRLCAIFEFPFEPFIIIVRLSVFSKGNA